MKIVFKKVPITGVDFKTSFEDIKFYGILEKKSRNLVQCIGKLEGTLSCDCARCGDEMSLHIDEKIALLASDGLYESSEELVEVIEFFDETVDLDTILQSEVETLKSDYHYCTTCSEN
ncbi:MAG TPA: DNA-binding protein [Sulfurospirillum arcachonense]|nr:DNA-binding protein [Sulfurospirillum arcachonense]HIP45443.1 DNA-binding protein [Sulfurospirillum arcachonense]